ncbi:MAG: hypothetical protein ACR2PZ_27815 [Pseudomonadales bacterium]
MSKADQPGNNEYAEDYEDVTQYSLDESREFELREKQRECTFMWTNKQGEPVGVIMSYLDTGDGRLWLTGSEQRLRFNAIKRDPRTCVCISSAGTDMGHGKTVTYKGISVIHDKENRKIKDWFYPEFSKKIRGPDPARVDQFIQFLDSPRRVVVEFIPTKKIVYDGEKMAAATPAIR